MASVLEICKTAADFDWAALAAFIAAGAIVYGALKAAQVSLSNQRIAAEIEISKLREKWLYSLRSDLAEYCTVLLEDQSPQTNHRIASLLNKIRLSLNPNDERTVRFSLKMTNVAQLYTTNDENVASEAAKLQAEASVFLKEEWEEMKVKLRKVYVKN